MHASDPRRSYPALVVAALTAAGGGPASTHIAGLPGGRVEDLLRRRPPAGRRLVVVEVGTNDWVGYRPRGPWRATPIAEFRRSYARLVRRLVGRGTPMLICLGVWGPSGERSEVGAALDGFDRVIAAECGARGGRFVPLSAIHDDPDARGPAGRSTPFGVSDETHPNDQGHALIAGLVAAAASRRAVS
jgi:lysophospholipase L1-like esterase